MIPSGVIQNNVTGVEGRGAPRITVVTKSDIVGEGVHANSDITNKKKICISSYFSLGFGQRGTSCALLSILVEVSFQVLA